MNLKTAQKTLLVALLPLFLSGCGGQDGDGNMDRLPSSLKVDRQSKTYVITGIGLSDTKKVAIINDVAVTAGEEIDDGVLLKDVQETYVVVLIGTTEHRLRPENIQNELDEKKN